MFEYDVENDEYNEVVYDTVSSASTGYYLYRKSVLSLDSRRSSMCSIKSRSASSLPRVISKSGRLNVFQVKIPKKYLIYFRDFGNTLLNIRWRWIITTLFVVNFISFFVFGLLFMLIAYISGDFQNNVKDICIVNTNNFTGYLLLSIETMLTIGYGYRYPTEACVQGWIVPFLQALVSVGIQGALVSAIYVKIAKPITKNSLGLFSKQAVVYLRDGKLSLVIRIADTSGKIRIGTNITMYFIDKVNTETLNIKQMKVEPYGFTIFPVEIVHVIDSDSPFWKQTPYEMLVNQMEVVVVAEGLSVITGQPSQNRKSYVNSDIFWGHRFASCVHFDRVREKYVINHRNVNEIYAFDTPLCSAEELNKIAEANFSEIN